MAGRKPDLELISAEERYGIKQRAGGDHAAAKAELMRLTRQRVRERAQEELFELRASGSTRTEVSEAQLRLAGDDFDPEWKDREFKSELRLRCQTDLFFLARDVLGKSEMTERTHRPICDFYVKKNPQLPIEQQDAVKERDLYDPRGSFKSTIQIIDAVQWIICFRNIAILFLAGAKDLPAAMVRELVDYFEVKDVPTRFQRLFPEFCITSSQRYETQFVAPCMNRGGKEPTVMAKSNESAVSGWHFDVIKTDDLVNNDNSQNPVQLEKVRRNFYINAEMLNPEGYLEITGTRYHPKDLYGVRIATPHAGYKTLTRASLRARPELSREKQAELERNLRDESVPSNSFRPEDWELLFPERLKFEMLMQKRSRDMRAFAGQQLNDPVAASGQISFTREQLERATVLDPHIPREGKIFALWDLAYGTSKGANSTAGGVARLDKSGRLFFLEVVHGKFPTHELEERIVDVHRRWQPDFCEIEDSMGAKWLTTGLEMQALRMGVQMRVLYFPIDKSEAAKDSRVRALEAPIERGRIFFSVGITCLEKMYEQFENWGHSDQRDIADMMALMAARHLPAAGENPDPEETERVQAEIKEKRLHDFVHGLGEFEPPEPEPEPDPNQLEEVCPGLYCG